MSEAFKPTDCLKKLLNCFFPKQPMFKELAFTQRAWIKMITYAHLAGNLEISGYGRIVDGKVIDVKLTEQEVESARVSATAESQINFIKSTPKDQLGQWILDWHSHVDMGAFSSSIDDKNYESQWECRGQKQFPVLIVNKRQEYHAECYVSPYNRPEIKIKIEIDKDNPLTEKEYLEMYEECKKDVEENVKRKTYTTYSYSKSNYTYGDVWYKPSENKKKENTVAKENGEGSNLVINSEECISCGCGLASRAEFLRGICDDCWGQMNWRDKKSYCDEINISISEAEGYFLN